MKKLINNIKRKKAKQAPAPSRITNDTVAEHRERVLAGGRKFKYPLQYARHKLVIMSVAICIAALLLIVGIGYWQLYPAQNTSGFMYRVTRVIPVPVADVDGYMVRYSAYLMRYRSSEHYLRDIERMQLTSEDGQRQLQHVKQKSLDGVVADAYAAKLAEEQHITVSDEELAETLATERKVGDYEISQLAFDATIRNNFDWSPDEYRDVMRASLLRKKVAYHIDENAKKVAEKLKAEIAASPDVAFTVLAEAHKNDTAPVSYGSSGWVSHTNQDGGLAQAALSLQKGQESGVITSSTGDGYYIVRLVDKNNTQVSYEYVRVSLGEFTKRLEALKKDGKVHYYISLPDTDKEA